MPRKKKDAPIEESITMHETATSEEPILHENEDIDTSAFDYIRENHTSAGADYKVKAYLSTGDQMKFCNHIVDTVYTEAGYTPALFDFAQKYATIVCYTDIALPARKGILDELNEVIYESNLIENIFFHIDHEQFNALISAAKDQIEYRNNLVMSFSESDNMYASINSILDKVNTWLDKNLKKLTLDKKTMAQLRDVMSKFGNVPETDLAKEIVKHVKTTEKDNVVEFPTEKN